MNSRRWLSVLAVLIALLAGGGLRYLAAAPPPAVVVVYFPDAEGRYLVPVTRSVQAATAAAALAELAAGPNPERPLSPTLAPGDRAELRQQGGEWIAASGAEQTPLAQEAIARTLLSTGEFDAVTVGGRRRTAAEFGLGAGQALIYYPHRGMVVPVPRTLAQGSEPNLMRAALTTFLAEPPPPGLLGPPPGVSLADLSVKGDVAHVRLSFSPELAKAVTAGSWNFSPYYLSVIYTLTEFPGIRRVQFEFPGMTAAALRQCRTPLSVPLPRPEPERGLAR